MVFHEMSRPFGWQPTSLADGVDLGANPQAPTKEGIRSTFDGSYRGWELVGRRFDPASSHDESPNRPDSTSDRSALSFRVGGAAAPYSDVLSRASPAQGAVSRDQPRGCFGSGDKCVREP
jgi:hypothetical protein